MSVLAIALNPTIDISSDTPKVAPTHKMRTSSQRWHAGGGGVNVARVIGLLGDRPELLILSGGETGALLEHLIAQQPLDVHIVTIQQQTRISFMVYEESTGLEYRFVPDGPVVSQKELDKALDVVRAFRGDYIVASGSLPRGVPDSIYADLARIAAANGIRYVLDTSGPALRETLAEVPVFMVKPSQHELEELVGKALDDQGIEDAAMRLVNEGKAQNVVVSLGGRGALLARKEGVVRADSVKVPVKSAVGAGDSFVGAMVWYLTKGHPMEDAFRFGIAAGAAAAMTPGTELCRREDVMSIFNSLKA